MLSDRIKRFISLKNITFFLSLIMFIWLVWYFYTGFGGPMELACYLVPVALLVQILFMYQDDYLYKRLPPIVNHVLVALYAAICIFAFYHFWMEYEQIAIWRQGSYTTRDFIVGLLIFLLVMELSRIAHSTLFWVNLVLVFYTMYGYLSPLDFFWHPGTSFYRIVTSSTVELATGIYGLYGQLALTVIAAFLILSAAANGFMAQNAMVMVMRRLAGRSRQTIPQTAVLASASIGLVSGSGAANVAVTGSFTIPLMIRYGVPRAFAGAVEVSASMGGLMMPPLMAAAGFLMAEFLGVPYWDVVLRGFALSFVYYGTLALSIYLVSVSSLSADPIKVAPVAAYDKVKTSIFFLSIAFLIFLLGVLKYGELRAALFTGIFMYALLILSYFHFKYLRKDPEAEKETLFRNFRLTIETHANMTSYLLLLLATLGIMIGLFTVTGFINRMGAILLEIGAWSIIATILMAWVFGWLAGAGLPPTATYIVLAVIVVDPLRKLGIDPWVAHFFIFLIAVWGELSPPTSLTAAVAARIADASFMRTMFEAVRLCLPITLMSFAIFTRSEMVVNPGWLQFTDTILVTISTCGISMAMLGKLGRNKGSDIILRVALALASFIVMFYPAGTVVLGFGLIVASATVWGVIRHRRIATPKSMQSESSHVATADEVAS
ncbi:MAG: TRAP transporter permease [Desulfobacteraceae bacterium]|nr:MAG: TRAP transporter permease [Desulfobacteraceae bacterium]